MGRRVLFVVKEIDGAEPIGALYVAGALRQAGHDCRFIGTRGVDVASEARRFAPHVLALATTTGRHPFYLAMAAELKRRNPRLCVLLGGPHATYFPESIRSPGIDVVCRGEGEDAAVELCDALDRGDDICGIRDLWVKHDGKIHANAPRELRRDLDSIPWPPREMLWEYDERLRLRPLKSFTTNRGCPFPCSYCFNPSLTEHYGSTWKKPRIRSPEDVVAEIAHVRAHSPLQVIGFRESIFVYSAKWLRAFGELYRSEIGLPYYCHLRADIVDEEMVELLAWSGCCCANVGIETADEDLANRVLKRQVHMDRLANGIRRLKKAGIAVFADNILGIPGATIEHDLRTLRLNIELDVDYAAATLCTPYPGTGIAAYALEHGYWDGDIDKIEPSYYTTSALRFSSPEEKRRIESLHKLFALTVALPALYPITLRALDLPENDWFYALFRSWYLVQHMTDIMPRRPDWSQLVEGVSSVFGVYRGKDQSWPKAPPPESIPIIPGTAAVPVTLLARSRRKAARDTVQSQFTVQSQSAEPSDGL